MTDCPVLKENDELKAENKQLKKEKQELIDGVRRKLVDEKPDTD